MEQHPVPQNVTTFQFKLIGDITLKQFAYLAGGIIVAYVSSKFTIIPGIFRWPLTIFSVLLGVGLAFVPIEERPLDRWIMAFIKSVYAPTQFVWKKNNPAPDLLVDQMPTNLYPSPPIVVVPLSVKKPVAAPPQIRPVISGPPVKTTAPLPKITKPIAPPYRTPVVKEPLTPPPAPPPPLFVTVPQKPQKRDWWSLGAPIIVNKSKLTKPAASGQTTPVTGQRLTLEEAPKPVGVTPTLLSKEQEEKLKNQFKQQESKLAEQIIALQKELQQGSMAKDRFMEVQQVLSQLLYEKERLSKEVISLRKKLTEKESAQIERPTSYTTLPQDTRTTVKIVSPSIAIKSGIPAITHQPNVVTGIIKDSDGRLLPNLIVTIKDKDGVPVRALKSNKLGQFAASTPLTEGVYVLDVEDPKNGYKFNRIEVSLANQVLPPLEISAISEKDVVRQKLTKELFGVNNI